MQICQGGCSEQGQLLNPALSPAEMAAMQLHHRNATCQAFPRVQSLREHQLRQGKAPGMGWEWPGGICRVWGRPEQHRNVTQQELGAEPWLCAQLCSAQGQAKSQALLPVIYLEHQCQSHTAPHQAQSLRSHPAARANVSTGYQVLQTSQLWLHLFLGWEQKVTLVSGKPYQYLLFAFILTR